MSNITDGIESLFSGEQNLSMNERAIYLVGGLGLAAAAATPRPNPLLNVLALAAGTYLAWSGYQGRDPIRAALFDDAAGQQSIGGPGQDEA